MRLREGKKEKHRILSCKKIEDINLYRIGFQTYEWY